MPSSVVRHDGGEEIPESSSDEGKEGQSRGAGDVGEDGDAAQVATGVERLLGDERRPRG